MKTIYEASNSVEAHMILNLLHQAGLSGRVDGEFLQGGAGELQAIGLVKVKIEASDYPLAKQIIQQWDAMQPSVEDAHPAKKGNFLWTGVFGFLSGCIVTALFYHTPITHDGIDYNNDGKLDEKWTYVDGYLSKTKSDRNFDGKTDIVYRFDREGKIESSSADNDFNGTLETNSFYDSGNLIWSESDTNDSGFKDYHLSFKHGVVNTITFYNATNKQPIKIQHYEAFKLKTAEVDTSGDGTLDSIYEYDDNEEIVRRSRKTIK